MEMREQDLRLLKQLIDIGETIQRLTRSRRMEETSHPAMFPLVHPDVDLKQLTESLCTLRPKRRFADLLGDRPDTSVPLLRRQSEPHLCRLDHLDVLTSSSRQGSSSSIGSCSVGKTNKLLCFWIVRSLFSKHFLDKLSKVWSSFACGKRAKSSVTASTLVCCAVFIFIYLFSILLF